MTSCLRTLGNWWLRLRVRTPANRSALAYVPGTEETIRLRLWPIEWRLRSRSRLRIDISSSDFPKFHAHTNYPGPWAEQAAAKVANQRIHIGGDRAGWVELPITTDP